MPLRNGRLELFTWEFAFGGSRFRFELIVLELGERDLVSQAPEFEQGNEATSEVLANGPCRKA